MKREASVQSVAIHLNQPSMPLARDSGKHKQEMSSCIIVLNWNGWKDTIECLESLFRLAGDQIGVVVCDNASDDGSCERIKQWARGELGAESANPELSHLNSPPVPKPIPYLELTREEAEFHTEGLKAQLTLIQNDTNLGFAGGNNVGLRYALGKSSYQYFWLLNNDTIVEPSALSALVRLMQQQPEVGLCGSLNLAYHSPAEIQAEGGKRYNRWTGRVRAPSIAAAKSDHHPTKIDFINGASMLVSRSFLETVGLMEESYFLYFEELDWAMRAKGKFSLGYAPESIVYHKEGASIGSNSDRTKRSLVSDRYLSRNRVLFTRRFFPWALPSVLISVCLAAVHRFLKGDPERARAMLTSMLQGLMFHPPKTRNT